MYSLQEPCFRNIHAMMTKKAKSGGMATTSETQAKDLVTVGNSWCGPRCDALRGSSVV